MKTLFNFSRLVLIATTLAATPVTIELPAETSTLQTTKGAELAQSNCLICHSAEYLTTTCGLPAALKP